MDLQMFYVKASRRETARGAAVPLERWAPDGARPCMA
jgi:hypothetical protein